MSEQNASQVPETREPPSAGAGASGPTFETAQGISWLQEGLQLVLKNPVIWLAISANVVIVFFVLGFIPWIGHLAANILAPTFAAGAFIGCRALTRGEDIKIEHLFAGFQDKTPDLLKLGLVTVVGGLLINLSAGPSVFHTFFVLVFAAAVAGVVWAAPALVMFRSQDPVDAVKASINACDKNRVPFAVYGGLLVAVLLIAGLIPFGLGYIVVLPVVIASFYAAYEDVFETA
ncbi:MAG: hypothetical protein WBP72_16015 [Rhodocyclaceae bacterium]